MYFQINGRLWRIIFVNGRSKELVDRTGKLTLATTDPLRNTVYISKSIRGELLERVIKHELSHCELVSYGYLHTIHIMTRREYWIDMEEWICNYIADHSEEVLYLSQQIIKGL